MTTPEPLHPGPFYHGTKAQFERGRLIAPGFASNFKEGALRDIYFSARLESAIWGAELAKGEGEGRIYLVEPEGAFENDPNLTDKKFPGNPTKSYRSEAPLRVVAEVEGWLGHTAEQLQTMRDGLAKLAAEGTDRIIDWGKLQPALCSRGQSDNSHPNDNKRLFAFARKILRLTHRRNFRSPR